MISKAAKQQGSLIIPVIYNFFSVEVPETAKVSPPVGGLRNVHYFVHVN